MPLRASRKARDKVAKVTSRVRAQKKAKIRQAKAKIRQATVYFGIKEFHEGTVALMLKRSLKR